MANKKILVIGNGFDIEHGLPTKYTDFLEGLRWFKENCDDNGEFVSENRSWEHGQSLYDSLKGRGVNQEFHTLGINNYWTEHFLNIYNPNEDTTKGWIDFEGEILTRIRYFSNIDKAISKQCRRKNQTIVFNQINKHLTVTAPTKAEVVLA